MTLKSLLFLSFLPVLTFAQETRETRLKNIRNYLDAVGSYGYAGQVVLAKGDTVLLSHSYGYANREKKRLTDANTSFGLASVSKTFTAVAILKLEMQGKLNVTDSLKSYFAACPADKQGITIHQLLTHTSGISGGDMVPDYAPLGKEELVARIFDSPLRAKPGSRWIYSNAGYSLLAALIERQSGKEYGDYLEQEIFRPSGMTRTFVKGSDSNSAVAYRGTEANASPTLGTFNIRTWGGGSVCSTAGDLLKFRKTLFSDAILSDAARLKLLSKHTPINNDGKSFYGYGCIVYQSQLDKSNLADFTGDTERGFNCTVRINLDTDETYISVSNARHVSENWNRWFIDPRIRNLWKENVHFNMPPPALKINKKDLEKLAGTYSYGNSTLTVGIQGDNLFAEALGKEAVALLLGISPEKTSQPPALEKAIATFMDSYRHGGTEGFRQVMSQGQLSGFAAERDELLSRHGQFKGYTIRGVMPDSSPEFLRCAIVLHFEKGPVEFFTLWNLSNAEKPMIDFSSPGEATMIRLYAATGPGTFSSYNFFKDQVNGQLQFSQEDGKITLKGSDDTIIFSKTR